jgi:hypothetical protein
MAIMYRKAQMGNAARPAIAQNGIFRRVFAATT